MKDTYLNIKVSADLKERFAKKCNDNLQSQSEVVRALMEKYIKDGMGIFKK